MKIRRVCVNCGSSPGLRPQYLACARRLGAAMARRGMQLVYGGADVGLMGEVAQAALAAGGKVQGVITPQLLNLVPSTPGIRLEVVETMALRKARMWELADAFVVLPGGTGTLDEMFEILCLAQLGLHRKPCGLLNVAGYYDHLLAFLDHAVTERFLRPEHRGMLLVESSAPARLLDRLAGQQIPHVAKWMDRRTDA